jgi:hypothetical protein
MLITQVSDLHLKTLLKCHEALSAHARGTNYKECTKMAKDALKSDADANLEVKVWKGSTQLK